MISLDAIVATTRNSSFKTTLTRTAEILKTPEQWTQGVFARTPEGEPVKPKDPRACSWCLLGALAMVSNEFGIIAPPLLRLIEDVMHSIYQDKFASIGEMNDYIDHESLLVFLDKSLARFQM